jgi:hypothetical protein
MAKRSYFRDESTLTPNRILVRSKAGKRGSELLPYLRLYEAMLVNAKQDIERFRGKKSYYARKFHREAWEFVTNVGPEVVAMQRFVNSLIGRESADINLTKLINKLAEQEPIDSPFKAVV